MALRRRDLYKRIPALSGSHCGAMLNDHCVKPRDQNGVVIDGTHAPEPRTDRIKVSTNELFLVIVCSRPHADTRWERRPACEHFSDKPATGVERQTIDARIVVHFIAQDELWIGV